LLELELELAMDLAMDEDLDWDWDWPMIGLAASLKFHKFPCKMRKMWPEGPDRRMAIDQTN